MTSIIITPPPVPPPVDPNSGAPSTLTITFYMQLAAHISTLLDEVLAELPKLKPAQIHSPSFIHGHLNISRVFLGSTIAAFEQLQELQAIGKFDPFEARDTLQLIEAFRPLRDKVKVFEMELANVLNARQAALAAAALDQYALVKGFARDPNNAPAAACFATLRRDLGRSGPKRKKNDSAPAAVPAAAVDSRETEEREEQDTEPRGHAARS